MATNDDLQLLNQSLSRIGAQHVPSFEDPGPAQAIPGDVYFSVRNDLLGKYPWHFTLRFGELTRTTPPQDSWRNEFLMPTNRLALPRAYYESKTDRHPLTTYELMEKTVKTDTETLFAVYQIVPSAAHFPSYFSELLRLALMAELAGAVREDWNLRKSLRREVYGDEQYQGEGGQFAVATGLDAQAQQNDEIDGGRTPLLDSRVTHGSAAWDQTGYYELD